MNTGQIISGAGHLGLIGWALIGGMFAADPPAFEVTEVTAVSAEDYAALLAPHRAPEAVADVATPDPPRPGDAAPDLSSDPDAAPEAEPPEAAATPAPDDAPQIEEITPPAEAEVDDRPPALTPPERDVAVMVPEMADRPTPRPAPRVAPEPVARPEPDTRVDEVAQRPTAPERTDTAPEPETEAAAPEEATTEIVTEAETPARAAPARSLRPRAAPARPAPADTGPRAPAPDNAAIETALAKAQEQADAPGREAPQGPPLTAGEKEALRLAVRRCWNVAALGSEALRTTVVVAVSMNRDGTPRIGSIRMAGAEGGSAAAAQRAFGAARRAILRCGTDGYALPVAKYERWRNIEMTFNPEKMRIK